MHVGGESSLRREKAEDRILGIFASEGTFTLFGGAAQQLAENSASMDRSGDTRALVLRGFRFTVLRCSSGTSVRVLVCQGSSASGARRGIGGGGVALRVGADGEYEYAFFSCFLTPG